MSLDPQNPKSLNSQNLILKQALLVTEVAIELRERHSVGEKYINYLKTLINGAERGIAALHTTSKASFALAQQLLQNSVRLDILPENIRQEYENLLTVVKRESSASEENTEETIVELNLEQLSEKIRVLETRNRTNSDNNIHAKSSSSRGSKIDINEKYPEDLSRESLMDLSTVANLPTVPEDIFTSFVSNKPVRSSSLSSIKSMRKVKMFLQKAESSDDDDSSDTEDHDYTRLVYGDGDETKASHSPSSRKLQLGNIKEETQD